MTISKINSRNSMHKVPLDKSREANTSGKTTKDAFRALDKNSVLHKEIDSLMQSFKGQDQNEIMSLVDTFFAKNTSTLNVDALSSFGQTILKSPHLNKETRVELLTESIGHRPPLAHQVLAHAPVDIASSFLKSIHSPAMHDDDVFKILNTSHHGQTAAQCRRAKIEEKCEAKHPFPEKLKEASFATKMDVVKLEKTLSKSVDHPHRHIALKHLAEAVRFIQHSGHFSKAEQVKVLTEFDAFLSVHLSGYKSVLTSSKNDSDNQMIRKNQMYENSKARAALDEMNKKGMDMLKKKEEQIKENVYAEAREKISKKSGRN